MDAQKWSSSFPLCRLSNRSYPLSSLSESTLPCFLVLCGEVDIFVVPAGALVTMMLFLSPPHLWTCPVVHSHPASSDTPESAQQLPHEAAHLVLRKLATHVEEVALREGVQGTSPWMARSRLKLWQYPTQSYQPGHCNV